MELIYEKLEKGRYAVRLTRYEGMEGEPGARTPKCGESLELGLIEKGAIETPVGEVPCWEFKPSGEARLMERQCKTLHEVQWALERELLGIVKDSGAVAGRGLKLRPTGPNDMNDIPT